MPLSSPIIPIDKLSLFSPTLKDPTSGKGSIGFKRQYLPLTIGSFDVLGLSISRH